MRRPVEDGATRFEAISKDNVVRRARSIAGRLRLRRGDAMYLIVVAVAYVAAAVFISGRFHFAQDRMMILAERVVHLHLDDPRFADTVDSVARNGRYYVAVGPLQVAPYLPFVPFPSLHGIAKYAVSLGPGIVAAWLALPLARAYGVRNATAYWVAGFTAFGTLLFWVSVTGNFYYLAHAESFLALTCFLLEWAGRRRPFLLGLAMAVSFLARPTTVLAAIPFGVALLWRRPDLVRRGILFSVPVAAAGIVIALFNLIRFGSPLESGYMLSQLNDPSLIARRAVGLFSVAQVPENLRLAFLTVFSIRPTFPYLMADPHGLSMLLVSPGLLVAIRAGVRQPLQRTLWVAAAVVALPVFLYYGGGYVQYGFRYSLDFTPFLIPLVAVAVRVRFGRLERALFVVSMASVTYGIIWQVNRF
jgi:hypothetical protein